MLRRRTIELLADPRARVITIVLALLLVSPALKGGLALDDHIQTLASRSESTVAGLARAPWALYEWAPSEQTVHDLTEEGFFPWWSDPSVRIRFFRPLSSLTLWLDRAAWPDSPLLMHAHSMLWFAALLAVASILYRQIGSSSAVATLALVLFAIDDARGSTVGWVCHRNTLIALTFGLASVAFHYRARSADDRRARWLSPLMLALGLLSAEAALQAVGYLVSVALVLDRGTRRERWFALAPHAAVLVAWKLFYGWAGYGAMASGYYVDPGREPLRFAGLSLERLPSLLFAQLLGLPAEYHHALRTLGTSFDHALLTLSLIVLALIALVLRPLFLSDARVRFALIGALLATIPVCGVSPDDRLLTATGFGCSYAIAALLSSLATRKLPARWTSYAMASLLVYVNLIAAPLALPQRSVAFAQWGAATERAAATVPSDAALRDQTLVIVNPPLYWHAMFFPLLRAVEGGTRPKHFRWLAVGDSEIQITRVDANTLHLTIPNGLFADSSHTLARDPRTLIDTPLRKDLEGMSVEVTRNGADGLPRELHVRFDADLEAATFRWLQWQPGGYVPFTVPAIGESVTLPKSSEPLGS